MALTGNALLPLTLALTLTLTLIGPLGAFLCYECNTIEGQCSDGRTGVKTINLIRCEGGQCAKIKTESKAFLEKGKD